MHLKKSVRHFFLATLGISERMVFTVLNMQSTIGVCEVDRRGNHSNRPNETSEEQKVKVRKYIKSFPTVESHYCRKHSQRQYLSPELSVKKCTHTMKINVKMMVHIQ